MTTINTMNKTMTIATASFDSIKPRDNINNIENSILSPPSPQNIKVSSSCSLVSHRCIDLQEHQEWGSGLAESGRRYSKRIACETAASSVSPSFRPAKRKRASPRIRKAKDVISKAFRNFRCKLQRPKLLRRQKFLCKLRHHKIQAKLKSRPEFVKELRKEVQNWGRRFRKEFTYGDLAKALEVYTTPEYSPINTALRNGTVDSLPEHLQTIAKNLKKALNIGRRWQRLKVCREELYRGSGALPYVPQVGATISDPGFTSTTWKKSVTFTFLNKADRNEERYLFVYPRHSTRTGVDIMNFSRAKYEHEVLFAPNTMFRIVAVAPGQTVEGVEGKITLVALHEMA